MQVLVYIMEQGGREEGGREGGRKEGREGGREGGGREGGREEQLTHWPGPSQHTSVSGTPPLPLTGHPPPLLSRCPTWLAPT